MIVARTLLPVGSRSMPTSSAMLRRSRLSALPLVALTVSVALAACAYPRRSTSLSPVRHATITTTDAPADIWRLRIVGAVIPPRSRGDLAWDGSDGLPDPFVRVYRDDALVYETPTLQDTLAPEWDAALPENLHAPSNAVFRFEIWDRDELGADPVGIFRHRGLPANVVPGADARVMMESGAQLSLHLGPPMPHRGVGIRTFEVRGDSLVIVEIETYSPAARAGLVPGDTIVAIGGQPVSALGSQRAPGALSMAGDRHQDLRVRGADGRERDVSLDRGFTWIVM